MYELGCLRVTASPPLPKHLQRPRCGVQFQCRTKGAASTECASCPVLPPEANPKSGWLVSPGPRRTLRVSIISSTGGDLAFPPRGLPVGSAIRHKGPVQVQGPSTYHYHAVDNRSHPREHSLQALGQASSQQARHIIADSDFRSPGICAHTRWHWQGLASWYAAQVSF